MTLRFLCRASALCAAMLSVAACKIQLPDRGDNNYVTGLRLLNVKAEPPEVAPGQTTTLTALVFDSNGRTIDMAWAYCDAQAPGGFGGVNTDCITNDSASFLHDIANGMPATLAMPSLDPMQLGSPDQTGGLYLPIRTTVVAGTDSLKSIYRLRANLTMNATPNKNPTIEGIYQVMAGAGTPSDGGSGADGGSFSQGSDLLVPLDAATPLVVHAGDKITLRAVFATGSAEQYMVQGRNNSDGGMPQMRTVTERLETTWYNTAGTLSDAQRMTSDMGTDMGMGGFGGFGGMPRDAVLTLDNNLPAPGGTIELWVVGRDGRGGSDSLHRTLILQ